jgi:hypothetical protein
MTRYRRAVTDSRFTGCFPDFGTVLRILTHDRVDHVSGEGRESGPVRGAARYLGGYEGTPGPRRVSNSTGKQPRAVRSGLASSVTALDAGEQPELVGAARLRHHLVVGLVAVAVLCWTGLLHRLGGALSRAARPVSSSPRLSVSRAAPRSHMSDTPTCHPPCASSNRTRCRIAYHAGLRGCRICVFGSDLTSTVSESRGSRDEPSHYHGRRSLSYDPVTSASIFCEPSLGGNGCLYNLFERM